ncbi:outer membrane protein [Microbulbifer sp. S227A]|uniref:outer membrane protein n=1 Tax=Microbulbifer sp. S227A TaxID=3415131 RepID=UPI003C7D6811
MTKRTTTALLLATAATASLAMAPARAGDFAGGYVGVQLGYAYGDFDLGSVGDTLTDFDSDSVIGGISGGYLWAVGNGWYLGPEFQYDWANITIDNSDTGETADFDGIARLNVIAGYELGDGMLYGSLGYAYTDVSGVGDFFDGSSDGYAIGLGYDWWVNDTWTVGAEYLYQSFDGIGSGGGDVDLSTIYLRTAFRF